MKTENQKLFPDEFEQAEKRGGSQYAHAYVEGFADGKKELSTENERSVAGMSLQKYKAAEILEMHLGSEYWRLDELGFTPHIINAIHEFASQQQGGDYQKLKDVFEELLNSRVDKLNMPRVSPLSHKDAIELKNKWREKAGIVLQEQKEK